jgi:hypothetical protein
MKFVLTLAAIVLITFAAELAAYLYSPAVGGRIVLISPLSSLICAAWMGKQLGRRRVIMAGTAASAFALALGYANYAFLYMVRVEFLHEVNAQVFRWFGSVFGALIYVTAILCFLVASVVAYLSRNTVTGSQADQ